QEGDVITITRPDGSTKEVVVDASNKDDINSNGISIEFDKPTDGSDVEVKATIKDKAGNTSAEGSDQSTVADTTAPTAPNVVINDGNDGSIDSADLVNGKVTATVKPVDPVQEGDVITITRPDGSTKEVVVDASNKDDINSNGISIEFDKPTDGSDVEVKATIKDKAGNTSAEGSDQSTVADTTAPTAPNVVINDGNDGSIDSADLVNGKVTATVKPVDPVQEGDVITITRPDGSTKEVVVDASNKDDINSNGISIEFDKPTDGSDVEVKATIKDKAGNTSAEGSDQSTVADTTAPPELTIDSNGNDTLIGNTGNDLLVGDAGGLKTNFSAGKDYNVSIVLDLSGSMNWSMDAPTNGGSANQQNPLLGESRLEIAKKGLKAFIQQMAGHDGVINLQIASFSGNGNPGDTGTGNSYNQVFKNVTVDNIDEILKFIGTGKTDGLQAAGGTQPELGFNKANEWFKDIGKNGFENQTYFISDGEPTNWIQDTTKNKIDSAFKPLAEQSKVFAIGVSANVSDSTVSRYDNTNADGTKKENWSSTNHGEADVFTDANKLIAYLIGGSENFEPAKVGSDIIDGGAGNDILFGDAMNTNHLTWLGKDNLIYPKYSGYSTLIAYLKAEVTGGIEPTRQDIYDYIKDNFRDFIAADATDLATKGGNDKIYGGAGNDIIIAGAGDDIIYGGLGDDIISTGRGKDTIMYDLLSVTDETGGNGTDTWVDYDVNDKINFSADFFEGLLEDRSNLADYITVENDGQGNAVIRVDRDGKDAKYQATDLLIIENKADLGLQDLLNQNQIIIG
ncbi:VWA domain-containing protein, partial [Acinetobacter silvestris]|uniref:VWA domain-containing protein n=1 Tax=Acinetobacter silvestris TaxID=1977882 RepID=UPI000A355C05